MTNLPTLPNGQVPSDPQQIADYYRQMSEAYAATEPVSGQSIRWSNGIMYLGDQAIPGNRFAGIVLDGAHINVYYGSVYNPNVILPPVCYAVGRDEHTMAPHPDMARDQAYFRPQADRCNACPHNVFTKQPDGVERKSCDNKRRLVLLMVGTYPQGQLSCTVTAGTIPTLPLLTMVLPVTSAKKWGRLIREAGATYQRPPSGVVADVFLYPHEKHGREAIGFNILGQVPDDWAPAVIQRAGEAQQEVMRGYEPPQQSQGGPGGFYGQQQTATVQGQPQFPGSRG